MRKLLGLIAATTILAGCGDQAPAINVTKATIAAGPSSAAVYARIDNKGGADKLVAIEIAGRVPISIHETSMDGGVMRMREVGELQVPANGRLELKSGGAHGMAMGVIAANPPGVPLTFRFAAHAPVTVDARVTGPGGMAMEHDQ